MVGKGKKSEKRTQLEAKDVKAHALIASCWRTQTIGWNWRKLVAVLLNGKMLDSAVCV